MSIISLSTQNFRILGQKNKSLGINVQGNVLICFKMAGDPNCNAFDPTYAQFSREEKRVTLAVVDVKQCRDVIGMSRETTTPITAVPSLILYVNGKPHAKYNGSKNSVSLKGFITQALNSNAPPQKTQTFMPQAPRQPTVHTEEHSWTPELGNPPSLKGVIKGGGYTTGNNVEEEEEMKLMIPDQIVPHNRPWEVEFHEMN